MAGGGSANEGRVEVCLSGRWGTVSDNRWSAAEAHVVCRLLGYNTQGMSMYATCSCVNDKCISHYSGVIALPSAHFGEGTGPVLVYNVVCSGTELGLLDCSYSTDTARDRNHSYPGVICPLR